MAEVGLFTGQDSRQHPFPHLQSLLQVQLRLHEHRKSSHTSEQHTLKSHDIKLHTGNAEKSYKKAIWHWFNGAAVWSYNNGLGYMRIMGNS